MTRAALVLSLVALASGASAQGFVDEPPCYSWSGGHKSAGSFSKCGPAWVAAAPAAKPLPVPAPMAAPVALPPQVSCVPPAKPIIKPKHKPKPKTQC